LRRYTLCHRPPRGKSGTCESESLFDIDSRLVVVGSFSVQIGLLRRRFIDAVHIITYYVQHRGYLHVIFFVCISQEEIYAALLDAMIIGC